MQGLVLRSGGRWLGVAVLAWGVAAWAQTYTPITVVVTDSSGAAVSGAEIRVTPGSPAGDKLITDEQGRAQLGMSAGAYKLHVSAQGFMTADQALTVADKPQTLSIVIKPGLPASGFPVNAVPSALQPAAVPLETTVEAPHPATSQPPQAAVLTIIGEGGLRGIFTPQTLREYPQTTVTVTDRKTNQPRTYAGVPLMDLLAHLGIPKAAMGKPLARYVVATGSDGFTAVLSVTEVDPALHAGTVLVADGLDGQPLDAKTGPFQLVVSEDKKPVRSVRNLVKVEVRTAE